MQKQLYACMCSSTNACVLQREACLLCNKGSDLFLSLVEALRGGLFLQTPRKEIQCPQKEVP